MEILWVGGGKYERKAETSLKRFRCENCQLSISKSISTYLGLWGNEICSLKMDANAFSISQPSTTLQLWSELFRLPMRWLSPIIIAPVKLWALGLYRRLLPPSNCGPWGSTDHYCPRQIVGLGALQTIIGCESQSRSVVVGTVVMDNVATAITQSNDFQTFCDHGDKGPATVAKRRNRVWMADKHVRVTFFFLKHKSGRYM